MGVDLGRCDVGVAEHGLHGAQVGATLEQMAREGVAEHVRRHLGPESGARRGAADDDPERLAREPPPARVHEEAAAIAPTRVERPDLPEGACGPSGGLGADRPGPLFLALARADPVPGLWI